MPIISKLNAYPIDHLDICALQQTVVDSSIEGQSYCNYHIHHDASNSRRPLGHYDSFGLHRRSDNNQKVTDSCHGWREVEIASIFTTATKYRWNGR